jgi:hypothetical protein
LIVWRMESPRISSFAVVYSFVQNLRTCPETGWKIPIVANFSSREKLSSPLICG